MRELKVRGVSPKPNFGGIDYDTGTPILLGSLPYPEARMQLFDSSRPTSTLPGPLPAPREPGRRLAAEAKSPSIALGHNPLADQALHRPRTLPAPLTICAAILALMAGLAGCKSGKLVWAAERKAQMGGEFIRLYDDGRAEYGYGVVTEKLKAEGPYHRNGDTLFFDDPSFLPHFSKGYLIEKRGTVLMESGFHFLVVDLQKP